MNYIFIHLVFGISGSVAVSASLTAASLIRVGGRVGTVELRALEGRTPGGFTPEFPPPSGHI